MHIQTQNEIGVYSSVLNWTHLNLVPGYMHSGRPYREEGNTGNLSAVV